MRQYMNFSANKFKIFVDATVALQLISDHENCIYAQNPRAVGVLLGHHRSPYNTLVTNSFAVIFDEDINGKDIWFIDEGYLERMLKIHAKVNPEEKLVGWYHSGGRILPNDMGIQDYFSKYTSMPFLVILNMFNDWDGNSLNAFVDQNMILQQDDLRMTRIFRTLSCTVVVNPSEEMALKKFHDQYDLCKKTNITLSIKNNIEQLKEVIQILRNICNYMAAVGSGRLRTNSQINFLIQSISNNLQSLNCLSKENLLWYQDKIMSNINVALLCRQYVITDRFIDHALDFDVFLDEQFMKINHSDGSEHEDDD